MNAPIRTEDPFHKLIHEHHMWGLWEIASQMTPHPRPEAVPHQWRWSLLQRVIEESATAVPVGDERRAMQLFNPGLNGQWATTSTLIAAVQVLLPGETARAHRHSPAAIRFIMQGNGAYTAVEGEKVIMREGDLVLTPSWQWHDHGNETKETVVWMDGLDVPLVKSLNAMFFEMNAEWRAPATKPVNGSKAL
jgi:gentisate 1,2-dioxygenase